MACDGLEPLGPCPESPLRRRVCTRIYRAVNELRPVAAVRTGADLARVRHALGWSIYQMGAALRLGDETEQGRQQAGKRVREMESGARPVTGPVSALAEALAMGFRPNGFRP